MKFLNVYRRISGNNNKKRTLKVVTKSMVDDSLFPALDSYTWSLGHDGYARTYIRHGDKYKLVGLHQMVWELSGRTLPIPPLSIDHINRNRIDNRIINLREASFTLQRINSSLRKDSKTGHRGVYFHRKAGKYQVGFSMNGVQKYVGLFVSFEEACRIADEYYGSIMM